MWCSIENRSPRDAATPCALAWRGRLTRRAASWKLTLSRTSSARASVRTTVRTTGRKNASARLRRKSRLVSQCNALQLRHVSTLQQYSGYVRALLCMMKRAGFFRVSLLLNEKVYRAYSRGNHLALARPRSYCQIKRRGSFHSHISYVTLSSFFLFFFSFWLRVYTYVIFFSVWFLAACSRIYRYVSIGRTRIDGWMD